MVFPFSMYDDIVMLVVIFITTKLIEDGGLKYLKSAVNKNNNLDMFMLCCNQTEFTN